jgi:cytoskeleton protein RodZ
MTPLGIGERLRSARLARGLSLDDVEAGTRIRRRFLEALEREEFDELPGPVYVRGFLRIYGEFLGIPAEELLAQCPGSTAPRTLRGTPVDVRITPVMPRSRARRVASGIALVLGAGAVLVAYTLYGQIREFAMTRPHAAARPPVVAASKTPPPRTPPPPQSGGGGLPAPSSPSPLTPSPGGPAPPSTAPTPGTAGGPELSSPIRLVVVATDRSWVRTVADGTTVFEGFLSAGDRQTWEAKRTLTIRIGNASALDLTVNGYPLGRLGNPGDVVEKTFTAGSPAPVAPSP